MFYTSRISLRRRQWQPTSVLLPGKSHGWRSLVGCSPWGREESDMTERVHFHLSLSCIGEGNGNALQCSCLENPGDGRAWWAAVYGVAQSRTRLKRLSSSSSRTSLNLYILYNALAQSLSGVQHFCDPMDCGPPGSSVHRISQASGLPFPPLGNLPNPGIEPTSSALAGGFFTTEPPGKPIL